MPTLSSLIATMPKAELHMHLEGSLEPELMFRLAARNGVGLPYRSEAELRAAYRFRDLQSFLEIYYAGLTVLLTERDFYDMTLAYLERVSADHVVHAEVFIAPQAHTRRGVPLAAVVEGVDAALRDGGRRLGMTTGLILGLNDSGGVPAPVAPGFQCVLWIADSAGYYWFRSTPVVLNNRDCSVTYDINAFAVYVQVLAASVAVAGNFEFHFMEM